MSSVDPIKKKVVQLVIGILLDLKKKSFSEVLINKKRAGCGTCARFRQGLPIDHVAKFIINLRWN